MDFFLNYKERNVLHKILERPVWRLNNGTDTNREHYLLHKVFSGKLNHIGVSEVYCQGPMIRVIIRMSCCHSLEWCMLNLTERKFGALKGYAAYTVSCHYEYMLLLLFNQLRSSRYVLVWNMKYPERKVLFFSVNLYMEFSTTHSEGKKQRCLCIV